MTDDKLPIFVDPGGADNDDVDIFFFGAGNSIKVCLGLDWGLFRDQRFVEGKKEMG